MTESLLSKIVNLLFRISRKSVGMGRKTGVLFTLDRNIFCVTFKNHVFLVMLD